MIYNRKNCSKVSVIDALDGSYYYVLWPQESSLSQVSDKVVMVIC